VNVAASLCMLALAATAAWAVLRPYQHARAVALERLADPLEDERGRALRHLRDLDDDRASGKLDEARYRVARADAEARAVAVLRALEARERTGELAGGLRELRAAQPRAQAPTPRRRRALVAGILAGAVVVVATVTMLRSAVAAREAGQPVTGASAGTVAGDDPTSLEFFQRRAREHPGDVAARLDLGQRYLDAGQVKEATLEYVAALRLDPGNVEAHTNLGLLLFQAGLPAQGLRSVEQALAVDPRYPEALYAKGLIQLMGLRQPRAATAAFRAYLAAAPFGSHRAAVERLLRLASAPAGAVPSAPP
jgi:tetratricopeptide (TPR) repeat protein